MKVPNHSLFAALLAAALTVGCTVNIQTRPDAEPGPEPAESEPDVGQVEPTNRRERDRVQPIPEPRRRTDDETIVRRSEPPRQEPETKAEPDTTKDETKTKETGRREKEDTRTTQPDTKAAPDPPDRPGVGKGRKESQETYPGKGKATGLEKQQDNDREPANQGNANGRNKQPDVTNDTGTKNQPTPDKKPDEKTGSDKSKDDRVVVKQPESKNDPVGKEQPSPAKKPDTKPDNDESIKEPVAAKQSAPDRQPDRKPIDEKRGSDPDNGKQQDIKNDSAVTKPEVSEEKPDKSNKAANAQKNQAESQPDAMVSKDSELESSRDEASPPARLGIQSKHLPSPGQCRVWIPGNPAGDQAEPRDCDGIESAAPPGSWVLYRPEKDKKVVHVRQMHQRRRGAVANVWIYETSSGKYVRQEGTK